MDFDASGDLDHCRVVSLGPETEARMALLGTRFSLEVDEGHGPIGVRVGPAESGYLALDRMSRLLRHGPLLTEDGEFYQHGPFSRKLLERALRLDFALSRYAYGGSTITQQLVKNLFVGRIKTLSRKLEEAFIVVAAERILGKDRILELYLNCIEYGTRIYGIENASHAYFGRSATRLTPLQIAFLMHLKPSPKVAWHWAKAGQLPQNWRDGIHRRMQDMVRFGYIGEAEVEAAAPWDPIAKAGGTTPSEAGTPAPPPANDEP
jgi:membrane peptidoglycan carboxypeptidase